MSGSRSRTRMPHPVEAATEAARVKGVQPEFTSTATNQLSLRSLHQLQLSATLFTSYFSPPPPLSVFLLIQLRNTVFSVLSNVSFIVLSRVEPNPRDGLAQSQRPLRSSARHFVCVFIKIAVNGLLICDQEHVLQSTFCWSGVIHRGDRTNDTTTCETPSRIQNGKSTHCVVEFSCWYVLPLKYGGLIKWLKLKQAFYCTEWSSEGLIRSMWWSLLFYHAICFCFLIGLHIELKGASTDFTCQSQFTSHECFSLLPVKTVILCLLWLWRSFVMLELF